MENTGNEKNIKYRHRIDYCPMCAETIHRVHLCVTEEYVETETTHRQLDRFRDLEYDDNPNSKI